MNESINPSMLHPGVDALSHSPLPLVSKYHKFDPLPVDPALYRINQSIKPGEEEKESVLVYEPRSSSPITQSTFTIYDQPNSQAANQLSDTESQLLAKLGKENERRQAAKQRLNQSINQSINQFRDARAMIEQEATLRLTNQSYRTADAIKQAINQANNQSNRPVQSLPWSSPPIQTFNQPNSQANSTNQTVKQSGGLHSELSALPINQSVSDVRSTLTNQSSNPSTFHASYVGSAINVSFNPLRSINQASKTSPKQSNDESNEQSNPAAKLLHPDQIISQMIGITQTTSQSNAQSTNPSQQSLSPADATWLKVASGHVGDEINGTRVINRSTSPTANQSMEQVLLAVETTRHRTAHAEVTAVTNRLTEAGLINQSVNQTINQASIERALGLDRQFRSLSLQQAGAQAVNQSNSQWPTPFANLVENPMEKKKKAASVKPAKGKKKGKK